MAEGHQLAGPPESSGRRRAPVQTRTFDSPAFRAFSSQVDTTPRREAGGRRERDEHAPKQRVRALIQFNQDGSCFSSLLKLDFGPAQMSSPVEQNPDCHISRRQAQCERLFFTLLGG